MKINYSNLELLEIEADKRIAEIQTSEGIPWWFFIRSYFLRFYLQKRIFNSNTIESGRKYNIKGAKYFAKSLLHDVLHPHNEKNEIIFQVSSRPAIKKEKYYNIYAEDYYNIYPNHTLIYENAPVDWTWPFPRENENVKFYAFSYALANIKSKVIKRPSDEIIDLVGLISDRVQDIFKVKISDSDKNKIVEVGLNNYYSYKIFSSWIIKECKKRKCKILIMDDGFLSERVWILLRARKEGIFTADLQHGAFEYGNLLYCYSPEFLKNCDMQKFCPDFFLSYGEWWHKQTNIPFKKKVVLGNPQRDLRLASIKKEKDKKLILFIGEAHNTDDYLDLAQKVAEKFVRKWEVIFRPHPVERLYATQIEKKYSGVRIDYNHDLYQELEQAYAVISEMSTVLFEAIGLSKRIIVWRTQYSKNWMADNPFEEFESLDELYKLMQADNEVNYSQEMFWNKDFSINYRRFVKKLWDSIVIEKDKVNSKDGIKGK